MTCKKGRSSIKLIQRVPLIKKPELLDDILQETEIVVECSVLDVCFSFEFRII